MQQLGCRLQCRDNGSGNLSLDFLAGFTIFIIAFIWVATMIPGLFINVNANSVDYNAVAYRTGVILAEDPGTTGPVPGFPCYGHSTASGTGWESLPNKCDIARFGLAVSKNTPNILDTNKVIRFFCWTVSTVPGDLGNFSYPADYQERAVFGDYPYRFNISLRSAGQNQVLSVGDILPAGDYGYIRRDVLIKGSSNTTIDAGVRGLNNTDNVTYNQFSLELNQAELQEGVSGFPHQIDYPAYQIDPGSDSIMINITNLTGTLVHPTLIPSSCNLVGITFYEQLSGTSYLTNITTAITAYNLTINDTYVQTSLPATVNNSVSLAFRPGAFSAAENLDPAAPIFINLTFALNPPQQYLNNTGRQPFDYNYNPAQVTQPQLQSGVLEVAVW